jgi:hypothetical protein
MQFVGITSHGFGDFFDQPGFGSQNGFGDSHGPGNTSSSSLGQEYLRTDGGGELITVNSNSLQSGPTHTTTSQQSPTLQGPASTLVGTTGGFQINLEWDSSVRTSANWQSVEAAVIAAATQYTQDFTNHVVLNIAVGYGEIDGSSLSSNALGESESYGYLTNYSTISSYLGSADHGLVSDGLMSSDALTANKPPTTGNFFITSAEAKALGLISGSSTAIDGYIGLSTSGMYFGTGTVPSNEYDAEGVVAHELTEVMGRIGEVGGTLGSYHNVYTPLDLFRYTSADVRDLSATTGFFSTHDGTGGSTVLAAGPTNLDTYNNPNNGGDASDWASSGAPNAVLNNSYDAFDTPGENVQISATDLLEDAALGYSLSSTGLSLIQHNTSTTV